MRAHGSCLAGAGPGLAPRDGHVPRPQRPARGRRRPDSSSDTLYVGRLGGADRGRCPPPVRPARRIRRGTPASWTRRPGRPIGTRLAFRSIRGSDGRSCRIVNVGRLRPSQVPAPTASGPPGRPDGQRSRSASTLGRAGLSVPDLCTVDADASGLSLPHAPCRQRRLVGARRDRLRARARLLARAGTDPNARCSHPSSSCARREPRRVRVPSGSPSSAPGGTDDRLMLSRGGIRRTRIGADGPGRLLRRAGAYGSPRRRRPLHRAPPANGRALTPTLAPPTASDRLRRSRGSISRLAAD